MLCVIPEGESAKKKKEKTPGCPFPGLPPPGGRLGSSLGSRLREKSRRALPESSTSPAHLAAGNGSAHFCPRNFTNEPAVPSVPRRLRGGTKRQRTFPSFREGKRRERELEEDEP